VNRPFDVEPVLRAYLADTGERAPDRVLGDVAARIARQPRRLALRLPWRPHMSSPLKIAVGLAAAIVVALVGYSLLPKGPAVGTPTTVPAVPTPSSTPVATAAALIEGRLAAGPYVIRPLESQPGLTITAQVPEGSLGYPGIPAVTGPNHPAQEPVLIGFMQTDGLFSDPCHWNLDGTNSLDQPGDVAVGPTVDALVAALKANTHYTSSAGSPIAFGAYKGQELELKLPGADVISTCDRRPGESSGDFFVFPKGFWAQGPDNRWRLFIVDVAGTRLITMISYSPASLPAEVAAANAIVDSFVITP
jgi:hypothetical protein